MDEIDFKILNKLEELNKLAEDRVEEYLKDVKKTCDDTEEDYMFSKNAIENKDLLAEFLLWEKLSSK